MFSAAFLTFTVGREVTENAIQFEALLTSNKCFLLMLPAFENGGRLIFILCQVNIYVFRNMLASKESIMVLKRNIVDINTAFSVRVLTISSYP